MKKILKHNYLLIFFVISLLFLGGLGWRVDIVRVLGLVVGMIILIGGLLNGKRLHISHNFVEYLVFLVVLFGSMLWSFDMKLSFNVWILFSSMSVFWLLAVNNKVFFKKWLFMGLVILGILFGQVFFLVKVLPSLSFLTVTPRGLVGAYSVGADHFMLGDYWGMLVVGLLYKYLENKNKVYLFFIGFGFSVLAFSLSRSGLVGLGVSLLFLFKRFRGERKYVKYVFWSVIFSIYVYMSTKKSVIFNRPYYTQSILGLFKYPFGVGMGNFELISSDSKFHILGLSGFSRVTHSILFEFLSGIGVFAAYFYWWFYRVLQGIFSNIKINEYTLMFIALTVDFIFNPTYLVSTMLWVWGLLLGILLKDKEIRITSLWRG